MKICLLGGSNSVAKSGFSFGLCNSDDFKLALGASSCIQNMHSLVKYADNVDKCNVIVTESNVNEYYNINHTKYDKKLVLSNLRFFYDELFRTGKPVVSVIIPVKRHPTNLKINTLCNEIDNLHRALCLKYGFMLIDIEKSFASLDKEDSTFNIIMPDRLHPLESFMYMLGVNLRNYLKNNAKLEKREKFKSNYFVSDDLPDLQSSVKANRRFTRNVKELSTKTTSKVENAYLCGIETWSNDYSQIKIVSEHATVIKSFNANLSFQEIVSPNLTSFTLESVVGLNLTATEPTVNVILTKPTNDYVYLTSLFFKRKDSCLLDVNVDYLNDISSLIPEPLPFIAGVNFYLKKQFKSILPNENEIDFNVSGCLTESAALLEKINLDLSKQLSLLAENTKSNK